MGWTFAITEHKDEGLFLVLQDTPLRAEILTTITDFLCKLTRNRTCFTPPLCQWAGKYEWSKTKILAKVPLNFEQAKEIDPDFAEIFRDDDGEEGHQDNTSASS